MIDVRLEALMRERGIGVVALSKLAGVHTTQLYTLLRGPERVHLRTLDKLCTVLNVTPGDLLLHHQDRRAAPDPDAPAPKELLP